MHYCIKIESTENENLIMTDELLQARILWVRQGYWDQVALHLSPRPSTGCLH